MTNLDEFFYARFKGELPSEWDDYNLAQEGEEGRRWILFVPE